MKLRRVILDLLQDSRMCGRNEGAKVRGPAKDYHRSALRSARAIERELGELRRTLILFLERSAFDDAECVCDPGDPGLECMAMRVLGWGKHWNKKTFERRTRTRREA